jgi:hypothetical protein
MRASARAIEPTSTPFSGSARHEAMARVVDSLVNRRDPYAGLMDPFDPNFDIDLLSYLWHPDSPRLRRSPEAGR